MNTKTMIIVAVIIIVVLVVALYLIYLRSTTPPIVSSAIQQYQQEFQLCAQQYTQAYSTFIKNSPQGFNQAELQTLAQLQSCMNSAGTGIANIAKSLGQNPLNVLANYLGQAILIVAGSIGAAVILRSLLVYVNNAITNGGTAASALQNAITRLYVNQGIITADQAAGIQVALNESYALNTTAVSDFATALVDDEIITEAEASSLIALDDTLMDDDLADTLDLLLD